MPELFRHHWLYVDGLLMHVVEAGDDALPALVLLHGWPQNWEAFCAVMVELSACAHVLAMDLPGIGGSKPAPLRNDKVAATDGYSQGAEFGIEPTLSIGTQLVRHGIEVLTVEVNS